MTYDINRRPSDRVVHIVHYEYGQQIENRLPTKYMVGRPSNRATHTVHYEYGPRTENRLPTKARIDRYRDLCAYQGSSRRVLTCDKCEKPFDHELYAENMNRGGYVVKRRVNVQKRLEYMRRQQGYMDRPYFTSDGRTLCRPCGDRWSHRADVAKPSFIPFFNEYRVITKEGGIYSRLWEGRNS